MYIPTLSARGWLQDPISTLDLLFAHFLASDYSQTYMYPDNVSSLPYLIHLYGDKPDELVNNIRDTLSKYMGRYFDTVDIDVRVDNSNGNIRDVYSIILNLSVIREDTVYEIGRILRIKDGKFNKVIKLNNDGIRG